MYAQTKVVVYIYELSMSWTVIFHDEFAVEFDELPEEVQNRIFEYGGMLEEFGSGLKRPYVDTLNGSKFSNMKELRFKASDGVWRVLFAFDPKRQAIMLIAGDKSGVSQTRFYRDIIKKADKRYKNHLESLK